MRNSQPRLGDASETTVWEGRRLSIVGTAVGHRLPTARYRVTSGWLYWTTGRIGAKSERVPMWSVRHCEVRHSVQQRARRVGDVIVSLQHPDYSGTPTFVVLEDIERPREVHRLISETARTSRREHDAGRDIRGPT
jgi:hypothetical protein